MEVKYGLPGARADVEHGAISALDVAVARNLRRHEMAAPDHFRVARLGLFQPRNMLLGNDQDVGRRLRIGVFEGNDVVVLVNLFRGKFAPQDSTEDTACGDVGHDEVRVR